jgi:hypothetical protein
LIKYFEVLKCLQFITKQESGLVAWRVKRGAALVRPCIVLARKGALRTMVEMDALFWCAGVPVYGSRRLVRIGAC